MGVVALIQCGHSLEPFKRKSSFSPAKSSQVFMFVERQRALQARSRWFTQMWSDIVEWCHGSSPWPCNSWIPTRYLTIFLAKYSSAVIPTSMVMWWWGPKNIKGLENGPLKLRSGSKSVQTAHTLPLLDAKVCRIDWWLPLPTSKTCLPRKRSAFWWDIWSVFPMGHPKGKDLHSSQSHLWWESICWLSLHPLECKKLSLVQSLQPPVHFPVKCVCVPATWSARRILPALLRWMFVPHQVT